MRKRVAWLTSVLTVLFMLTGCTPNQQAIFDASMKMQKATSLQQHMMMSFELNGSGFEPAIQQQIDTTAAMLNTAKVDLTTKTSGNEQKTIGKSQIDMSLDMQGLSINMPIWVDMDLTGENPRLVEIMKVPAIATASFPSQFANKEYMVLNPYEMNTTEVTKLDLTKLMEFSKNFQTEYVNFLTSYAQRYNPNLDVVKVPTNDGTQKYTLKINDAQFKELISYTVNNFAQDKEAMEFIQGLLTSMAELGAVPDDEISSSELDQAFNELDTNIPQFLAEFNALMEKMKNVTLLGDKGLELNYTISNGYVANESGILDLKVDLSQFSSLMNGLSGQEGTATSEAKGALNLMINFNTETTGINTPIDIQIPELTSDNSFNYMDLMTILTASPRLAGMDRYQTARAIGEDFNKGKSANIILASGTNFPDALSASILSKKYNAPILLVGPTVGESSEAFDYIAAHSNPYTKVYIIGGTGVIDESFATEILKEGFTTERLSGLDLYETNMAVVNNANVKSGTPVIIASGENFPDALSVSSFAGSNQYPTLLVGKNYLAEKTKNYILTNKPSTVYIAGGVSVVSQSVEDQIKALVPGTTIKRLAGNDRFETTGEVINEFASNPNTLYIANGYSFADALAGSALAAKTGDPILLVDNNSATLSPAIKTYLKQLRDSGNRPMVRTLGGEGVVPAGLVQQVQSILMGIE